MTRSPKTVKSAVRSPNTRSGAARATRTRANKPPLGRDIWLDTARRALIEEGTAGIEINKLAKRLGSSRGGFYWFFKDRARLLDELVQYWAQTSTVLFERILDRHQGDGSAEYLAMTNLWVDEKEYDPQWDGAIRDWARTSEAVRRVVQDVDQKRIGVLEDIFRHIGYQGKEANVRARVMYYHQVGYYAMGVRESRSERRALIPFYRKVLTGRGGGEL
jgi:AcrR family transcriptional regulator